MSINSYLESLASALVLSSFEKDRIITSIDAIKGKLKRYFGNEISELMVFGSFTRGTILPRKADEKSDIDLMVVFKNPDGYKPQSFLNRLKCFAESQYLRSEIYQSSPTIVLELNHIKFELVPAYLLYGLFYQIPKGPSDWMLTDPAAFQTVLKTSNELNSYRIKPIIRLLKHWNVSKNDRKMASFELERFIASGLKYAYISCTSYTDYVLKAFEAIKDNGNCTKVDATIDRINKALKLEKDGMSYTALSEIKKVFPEI